MAGQRRRAPWPRALAALLALVAVAGLLVAIPRLDRAEAALPPGFTSTPVFTGLTLPTAMAFSPDGKVYVAEKDGLIKVFPNASSDNATVFKNLRDTRVFGGWDRGLLGLTVDPRLGDGSGHDFVYALYTKDALPGQEPPHWGNDCPTPPNAHTDGCVVTGALSRIPVNANGTAGTEQMIIDGEWCQQFSSHSVGNLAFGPDGNLYVTGGEGASYNNPDWGQFGGTLPNTVAPVTPRNPCGDPPGAVGVANSSPTGRGGAMRSQSPRRPAGEPRLLNGAVLRINPDTGAGVPGNPLYSAQAPAANASRILAYGLRNPYRFTTRPGTSEIWLGDVGWGDFEEINRIPTPTPARAPNFGWPCLEGSLHLAGYSDLDMCNALYNDTIDPPTAPYFTYEHYEPINANDTCALAEGSATSGLEFYSGSRYPAQYQNALFFGDYARNCLFVMTAGANGLPDPSTARTFIDDADNPFPVDLEVEPVSKDIFYVNIGLGTVNRITYESSNRPPSAVATATPTTGNAPLAVQLNGSSSTDPDGDTLTYSWDTDGNGTFGDATGPAPTVTYVNGGTYQARLMVNDIGGLTSTSAPVTITVASVSGPVNSVAPVVSGVAQVGESLSSSTGSWSGTAPISFGRQWQRCTTTTGTAYAGVVGADSPSVHWRLGDTSTTAADASGNSRPGAFAGGVALGQPGALTGDADTAVSLDGADDRVFRNPAAGITGTGLSTDLWLKTSDTTKEAGIVAYAVPGSIEEFALRDPRSLDVYVKGSPLYTGVKLNDGLWHHLAVTWDSVGGAVRVYKDGVLAYSGSVQAGASITAGGALVLGQDQDSVNGGFQPAQAFLGQLDEVALYPSALSAARVAAHRQAGISGAAPVTTCADINGATGVSYSPQLSDEGKTLRVQITATNSGGTTTANSTAVGPVTAGAGNTPPQPFITTPSPSFNWKAGDPVGFSGGATDTQDGNVPEARLAWNIVLGHCTTLGCHEHPLATRTGVDDGEVSAPDHEAPSYIELTLTATDAVGATASVTRRVDPLTVSLTFQTDPAGLPVSVGAGQSTPTAFTQSWVVNSQVQVNAPLTQTIGADTYTFDGWSDGGASTHSINVPTTNTTYTASYSVASVSGPVNSVAPVVSGVAQVGGSLSSSTGSWSGTAPISFGRQWQRCTTTTGPAYAGVVGADNPSVHWRLGDTTAAAADASGNSRPGAFAGGVALGQPGALTGDGNTAVSLDGVDDRVFRNPAAGISGTGLSTDLWLKTSDTTKEAGIVAYAVPGSIEEFALRDPRSLDVYVKGSPLYTGVKLNDGLWHHLAVTWDSVGGAVRVYKDGVLAYSGSVQAGASITAGGALVLGQDQDSVNGGFQPAQAFLGQLDEVALYPSALSAARVAAHRQAGISGAAPVTTCADINGATGVSYSPQLADEGKTLRVQITATNSGGTNTANSTAVGPVTAAPQCTGYSGVVGADGPSVFWRLGDSSATAADASGNSRPGSFVGGVALGQPGALTGDADTAVSLDGADDRVLRNPAAGISGPGLSTDLWLKTSDTTKEAGIVAYAVPGSIEEFSLRDPRSLDVYVKGTPVYTGVKFNDGLWHHLAVTWDSVGGALRVYKDGVLAFSGSVQAGASITAGGALVLGQDQDSVNGGFQPAQAFLGQLDEVALYPSVLSAARVAAHRQAGLAACP